jgi:hypothetical protein
MNRIVSRRWLALTAAAGILIVSAALMGCNATTHPGVSSTPGAGAHAPQPSASATDSSSGASITLQSEDLTLTSAAHLNFTATGFSPGETVTITIMDSHGHVEMQLAPVKVEADGSIPPVSQVMPADLAPGPHVVRAQGQESKLMAQAVLQVRRVPPTVQLDTYTGKPGYDFGVSGGGFTANEAVDIFLGDMKSAPLATLTAGAGGNITGRVKVPVRPAGEYSMYFVGRVSRTPASIGFNIQGFKPWVLLDTYAPEPGGVLRFSGNDFAPGEQVRVYLTTAHGQPITTLTADSVGAFTHAGDYVIPNTMTGRQVLVFLGAQSQASATAEFEVLQPPATPGGAGGAQPPSP